MRTRRPRSYVLGAVERQCRFLPAPQPPSSRLRQPPEDLLIAVAVETNVKSLHLSGGVLYLPDGGGVPATVTASVVTLASLEEVGNGEPERAENVLHLAARKAVD